MNPQICGGGQKKPGKSLVPKEKVVMSLGKPYEFREEKLHSIGDGV